MIKIDFMCCCHNHYLWPSSWITLLLSLLIACSIHVTPVSVMYWLSETVFRFDGDSNANVSAEQGMTRSCQAANTAIREHHISHFLHSENGTIRGGAKYEQIFADFHWIFGTKSSAGVYQSRIGQTFKSLFHNQLPSAATDDGGKLGLILHQIEIFILNVKPRLRLSLFWTVVGSFHPHQNFNFKFWN